VFRSRILFEVLIEVFFYFGVERVCRYWIYRKSISFRSGVVIAFEVPRLTAYCVFEPDLTCI
jgi:hypothetical protein